METKQVQKQLEYVHCEDIVGSTPVDVQMAIPEAISCATVMTWTTIMVGSSPICHISTSNLPELPEHGSATTRSVDLMAINDQAAKDKDTMKDMEDRFL